MVSKEMIDALLTLSYGLYIVSSRDGDKVNGQLANAVCQVTAEPPKVVVGLHHNNLTHAFVAESRVLSATVLAQETPPEIVGLFGFKSGRDVDKMARVRHEPGVTGAPVVLDHAVSYFEAKVVDEKDVGTHTLFVAEVVEAKIVSEAPVLTYEYYRDVRHGKASKNAPTYRGPEKAGETKELEEDSERSKGAMKKYVCDVCGYVYDPQKGDPDSGVAPGTAFEDLPDDWVCPVCGAGKGDFSPTD